MTLCWTRLPYARRLDRVRVCGVTSSNRPVFLCIVVNSQKWESLIRDGEDQPWNYPGALRGRGHGWGHLALVRARCGGGAHRRILKRKGKNTDTTQPPRSQAPRFALVNRLSYTRGIMLLGSIPLPPIHHHHSHRRRPAHRLILRLHASPRDLVRRSSRIIRQQNFMQPYRCCRCRSLRLCVFP